MRYAEGLQLFEVAEDRPPAHSEYFDQIAEASSFADCRAVKICTTLLTLLVFTARLLSGYVPGSQTPFLRLSHVLYCVLAPDALSL